MHYEYRAGDYQERGKLTCYVILFYLNLKELAECESEGR